VHVQNMSKTRVGSAKDIVKRGQEVWVKVISMQGQKISLSMRDVDQVCNPARPMPTFALLESLLPLREPGALNFNSCPLTRPPQKAPAHGCT